MQRARLTLEFSPLARQRRVGLGRRGGGIDDPLEPEGRGSKFLHSCRYARHLFRAKYRKQDAPWLALDECVEDSEASITFKEFRTLAWEAANEKARDLGWVTSCEDLHEAVKRAGGAP